MDTRQFLLSSSLDPESVFEEKIKEGLKKGMTLPNIVVEHFIISWRIENFCALPLYQGMVLKSPVFVSSTATRWYILFSPKENIDNEDSVSLFLHRSLQDDGPVEVLTNYRMGLRVGGNKVWLEEKKDATFCKGKVDMVTSSVFGHLQDLFECAGPHDNSLYILCEFYELSAKPLLETRTEVENLLETGKDLLYLSYDMSELFSSHDNSDVSVWGVDFVARAHRAVLTARSEVFARMLADGTSYIELPDVRKDLLKSLLIYIYTGNFNQAAVDGDFRIGTYEMAYGFGLSGLRDYLVPSEIYAQTEVMVENFIFAWMIPEFSSYNMSLGQCLESPLFRSSCGNSWNLRFYPNGVWNESDHVGIFLHLSEEAKQVSHLFLKISVVDSRGIPRNTLQKTEFMPHGHTCGFPRFIPKAALYNDPWLLQDNTVIVRCYLKCSVTKSDFERSNIAACTRSGLIGFFEGLSNDLGNLHRSGKVSDVTLTAEDEKFNVHRVIMSARSRGFSSAFKYDQHKGGTMHISGTDPDTLRLVIDYVYSAKLDDLTPDTAIRIYEVAGKYAVHFLKYKCRDYLKFNLAVGTVCQIVAMAHAFKDSQLKEECVKFIGSNAGTILPSEAWQKLVKESWGLGNQILQSIHKKPPNY